MAEPFNRWESDPLFSAAETVQDSADRMETIYRLLLHENTLLKGNNADVKLLGSIHLHRRDLVTALETTKWQLEDFQRAVHFSAFSDKSNSRTNATSRHREFVQAIYAQIGEVEKILDSMSTVYSYTRNSQLDNLQELDTDGLALFLSGGSSEDNHVEYHLKNKYPVAFCESTSHSDEIIELKPEEAEVIPLNLKEHPNQNFDFEKDKEMRNGLSSSSAMNYGSPLCRDLYQMSMADKDLLGSHGVSNSSDLEIGESNAKEFPTMGGITTPVSEFVSKLWYSNMNKLTRGFTKRMKDGELTNSFMLDNVRQTSSNHIVNSVKQVYFRVGSLLKRFQRVLSYVKYGNIPIRMQLAFAILIALLILGLMVLHK